MAKKILVIEDERTTRSSIINFLESEGFQTLVAENGRQGIDLAQQHLPDLIICDILMPELDGYDVLTTLQQEPQTASIPFIFLTVTATEAGLRQSLDMGADDYLSKPITSEKLRQAIALQLSQPDPAKPDSDRPAMPSQTAADLTPTQPDRQSEEFQQFLQGKELLFHQLSQSVRQQMLKMVRAIHSLKQKPSSRETEHHLNELQEISTRLLTLVNEVTALHNVMTPENTEALLKQFNFSEDLKRQ